MPMPVSIEPAGLEGVLLVKTGRFDDDRGYLSESYSRNMWATQGFTARFVQDNLSKSRKGTLRGMHYQLLPHGMGKLVRCLQGAIYDVAIDLRKGSPSHGQWVGHELSEANGLSMWVPVGFAHGFLALDDCLVLYKCTAHHAPECERGLAYHCPKVNISWPEAPTLVSERDAAAPGLDEAEHNFVYTAAS